MILVLVITCLRGRFGINCPSVFLKNFEIAREGQFQNFRKSRGSFIPKTAPTKRVINGSSHQINKHFVLKLISFK